MEIIAAGKSEDLLYSFPVHSHGYWELIYNFEGHGIMTIDNAQVPFKANELFLMPPETPHFKTSEEGFRDISVFVKDMRPVGVTKPQRFEDDGICSLYSLMNMIDTVYNSQQYSFEHSGAILNALGESIYQILSGMFANSMKRDIRIDSFIKNLEEHISDPEFEMSDAIAKTGYSEGYLRRVFKKETGENPVWYFNRLRIEKAQKLIASYGPSRTLKEVGLACGFIDPYYFSRVFKKVTGISPTEYTRQLGSFDMKYVDGDMLRPDLHE